VTNVNELLRQSRLQVDKERATRIADKCVPKYRDPRNSYSCTSHTAQLWQAAWDGAMEAMGYDNEQFKCFPSIQGS